MGQRSHMWLTALVFGASLWAVIGASDLADVPETSESKFQRLLADRDADDATFFDVETFARESIVYLIQTKGSIPPVEQWIQKWSSDEEGLERLRQRYCHDDAPPGCFVRPCDLEDVWCQFFRRGYSNGVEKALEQGLEFQVQAEEESDSSDSARSSFLRLLADSDSDDGVTFADVERRTKKEVFELIEEGHAVLPIEKYLEQRMKRYEGSAEYPMIEERYCQTGAPPGCRVYTRDLEDVVCQVVSRGYKKGIKRARKKKLDVRFVEDAVDEAKEN